MKIVTIIFLALACANAASVKSSGEAKAGETVTINGVNYWIEHQPKIWVEASSHCVAMGMQLVTLDTNKKDTDIATWLINNGRGNIYMWTGGDKVKDTFVWGSSGASFHYTRWYPGEPNDKSWDICVMFQGAHGWHDYSCDYAIEFMCEPQSP